MRALIQSSIQPEQDGLRRGRGTAAELLHIVDEENPRRRLAKAYEAHAAAGILPAKRNYTLKRSLDLALAVPALLLTLPLYPLITMITRLETPGPGLYRQIRVGKDGHPFVAYKFRTMRHAPPEQARAAHLEIVAQWMAGTPVEGAAGSPRGSLVSLDSNPPSALASS